MFHVFFFFKQKTAYELRISDWSSDVCSSDLVVEILHRDDRVERFGKGGRGERPGDRIDILISGVDRGLIVAILFLERDELGGLEAINLARWTHRGRKQARDIAAAHHEIADLFPRRSEEHTSELQSLMRISYAVFCLTKTKKQYVTHTSS